MLVYELLLVSMGCGRYGHGAGSTAFSLYLCMCPQSNLLGRALTHAWAHKQTRDPWEEEKE